MVSNTIKVLFRCSGYISKWNHTLHFRVKIRGTCILKRSIFTFHIYPKYHNCCQNQRYTTLQSSCLMRKSVTVVYYNILVLLSRRNTNRRNIVSFPKAQANLKHISALVVLGPKLRKCGCSSWDTGHIKYPGTNRIRIREPVKFSLHSEVPIPTYFVLRYPQLWTTVIEKQCHLNRVQ